MGMRGGGGNLMSLRSSYCVIFLSYQLGQHDFMIWILCSKVIPTQKKKQSSGWSFISCSVLWSKIIPMPVKVGHSNTCAWLGLRQNNSKEQVSKTTVQFWEQRVLFHLNCRICLANRLIWQVKNRDNVFTKKAFLFWMFWSKGSIFWWVFCSAADVRSIFNAPISLHKSRAQTRTQVRIWTKKTPRNTGQTAATRVPVSAICFRSGLCKSEQTASPRICCCGVWFLWLQMSRT